MRLATCIALATLVLISMSFAQQPSTSAAASNIQASANTVPNLIRYSGTLKDIGAPADSTSAPLGVTFSIYKQQEGGAPVWMETQNVTLDGNGQYSVLLGSTKAEGVPAELFSDKEERWLGVQVQGQAEQTRVLLVSVPYAFKAHEAETLGGLPASAFVKAPPADASGSLGTDTRAAVNAWSAAGNANISAKRKSAALRKNAICATLTANASANFIPLFDPTVCNLVNLNIYQVGNNVGIGTKIPSTALEVAGAITADQWYDISTQEVPFLSVGWPAGRVIPSNQNTWLGYQAGGQGVNSLDSGISNTFVGYNAAARTHTGSSNTAVGGLAGRNVNGNNNTFAGFRAGFNNFNGNNNTIAGYFAGFSNTADGNSFYGYQSGMGNTTGVQNTFLGYQTGLNNTVGISNVFVGYNVGQANVTESFSTFVGANAGLNSTVGGNTLLGYSAASATTTGSGITAVGYDAGRSNTTGFNNVYVGTNADFNANGASATGSGNVYIGVGAGSSDFAGGSYTRSDNTFVGTNAGFSHNNTTGGNNVFIGAGAGSAEGNVSNNIEIGNTGPAYEVGFGTNCLAKPCSNQILIGTLGVQTDTYIQGIYNAPATLPHPSKTVCVDPNGKLWGGKTFDDHCNIIVSSRRFKDQIRDMGDSSSKLFQLRPVTFFYKPQYDDGSHTLQYGLVAEEVASVDPNMAIYDKNGQPYSVKYQLLAPMLLNELQKQHGVVTAQQGEMRTLRQQVTAQEQQMLAQQQEIEGLKAQLQLQNASFQDRLSRLESAVGTQMKTASDKSSQPTTTANGGLQ